MHRQRAILTGMLNLVHSSCKEISLFYHLFYHTDLLCASFPDSLKYWSKLRNYSLLFSQYTDIYSRITLCQVLGLVLRIVEELGMVSLLDSLTAT